MSFSCPLFEKPRRRAAGGHCSARPRQVSEGTRGRPTEAAYVEGRDKAQVTVLGSTPVLCVCVLKLLCLGWKMVLIS